MSAIPSSEMGEDVLKAVARLKSDPDFQVLVDYLETLYLVKLKLSATPDDVASRWQQGGALLLDELLDNIEKSDGRTGERKFSVRALIGKIF